MLLQPLLSRYPTLATAVPHLSLGRFPTPVFEAPALSRRLGLKRLYIKNDGVCGGPYGGNKVRKLEYLLAQARKEEYPAVLTFGCAGSNHALATTLYARSLGMHPVLILLPQPRTKAVCANLLADLAAGAEIHYYQSPEAMEADLPTRRAACKERTGKEPFVIPPGGSSPVGSIGYVNAAFELMEQIENGELPVPGSIYLPAGTLGTAAGLMVGLRAAGIDSRVVSVRVTDPRFATPHKLIALCNRIAILLSSWDPAFTIEPFTLDDVDMRDSHIGRGYGYHTPESIEAIRSAYEEEQLPLDGTYSGKALAALRSDVPRLFADDRPPLFWNTLNGHDTAGLTAGVDYRTLPKPLHHFFEE